MLNQPSEAPGDALPKSIQDYTPVGKKVLVVDDLPQNTRLLQSFLTPLGYEVYMESSGHDALDFVRISPPDAILLDLMMPVMDGFEVCTRLKESPATRHIPVIIITGMSDREANIRALEAGADDFLTKPFDRVLLQVRIAAVVKSKLMQDALLEYQRDLEWRVKDRTRQVELAQQVTVFSLSKLAESRDNETGDHLDRIRAYSRELASELLAKRACTEVVDEAFVEGLYLSSPLHDIGKVGIPDCILLKPAKLTYDEFEIMKTHSKIGGDTLRAADLEAGQSSFLAMSRDIAYYHHEKWDGSGYPFGLEGEAIPLAARIVALADVYDALSSKRPYKEPMSHEESKTIILEGCGKHFDPRVVDAFQARESQFIAHHQHHHDGSISPLHQVMQKIQGQTTN